MKPNHKRNQLFALENKSKTLYYSKNIEFINIMFTSSKIIYITANLMFVHKNKREHHNHAKLTLSKSSLIYLLLYFITKSERKIIFLST